MRRLVRFVVCGSQRVCADSETGEILLGTPGEGGLVLLEAANRQTARDLAEEFSGETRSETWRT